VVPDGARDDGALAGGLDALPWRERTGAAERLSRWRTLGPARNSSGMAELTREADLVQVLGRSRVVAVLGAHSDTVRPAGFVPEYLHEQGYRVLPVNPAMVGQTLWGEPVVASLTELEGPIDLVDVFRRSEALPAHMDQFLAMDPARTAIWFQAGIRNDEVAAALVEKGYDVVQDRCTLADHRRFSASGLLPLKEAKAKRTVKAKAKPVKPKPAKAPAKGRAPRRRGPAGSS
jgi:predicted CoA-binding protein